MSSVLIQFNTDEKLGLREKYMSHQDEKVQNNLDQCERKTYSEPFSGKTLREQEIFFCKL